MNDRTNKKRVFTRKPHNSFLYKWSPENNINAKSFSVFSSGNPSTCDALPYSQGEDWITTYTYQFTTDGLNQHQYAYVACGYVE